MKQLYKILFTLLLVIPYLGAQAQGWPANYEGVMLQGFYWDSFKDNGYGDTKWKTLENQADELSSYFDLIWVPNSAQPAHNPGMGYDPVYWFTHHTTPFGTESELRSMIKTFKEKGTGIIEDVVINHRSGATNWYDFPSETWNGKTYHLTNGCITSGDEVWSSGQNIPSSYKGNRDTGDDFGSSRDLDHTNATVREHIKAYCDFLLNDLGYTGFRYDMVKGYSGEYIKEYNNSSKPKFSVGECWDNYDVIAAWIEKTGRTSAAFDFPGKWALTDALHSGDMTKLAWSAPGGIYQPAGLIHYGYPLYAVTFVDNHDTFHRDENNDELTKDIAAANAFILLSPGTPCILYPHYVTYKEDIQSLIKARKSVGIHSGSRVTVRTLDTDCYAAEVVGTKGKAIVKIGSRYKYDVPSGYKIAASGDNYCVWTTSEGGETPGTGNQGGGNQGGSVQTPSQLYMQGNVDGAAWSPSKGTLMGKNDNTFSVTATIDDSGDGFGYFAFSTVIGPDWDNNVNTGDRFGATSKDLQVSNGNEYDVVTYAANKEASGCLSWKIEPGNYTFTVDFANMKLFIGEKTGGNQGGGNQGGGNAKPAIVPDGRYAIFVKAPQAPYIWAWPNTATRAETFPTVWPGEKMTLTCSDGTTTYYYWVVPAGNNSVNVILNFNGDEDKTGDLKNISGNTYFEYNGITDAGKTLDQKPVPSGITITSNGSSGENQGSGNEEDENDSYPQVLYLMGNIKNSSWEPNVAYTMTKNGSEYSVVATIDDAGLGSGYFSFATVIGPDWDNDVNSGDRYGAPSNDTPAYVSESSFDITKYAAGENASSAASWMIAAGEYKFVVNLKEMTLTISDPNEEEEELPDDDSNGIYQIENDNIQPIFFNLQGIRVENPTHGIFIKVTGNKREKIVIR